MSAAPVTSTWSSHAMGGLAGSRIAVALALSVGIHAGAAVWFSFPSLTSKGRALTPVDVQLVSAAPRPVLVPVPGLAQPLVPVPAAEMAPTQPMPAAPAIAAAALMAVSRPAATLRAGAPAVTAATAAVARRAGSTPVTHPAGSTPVTHPAGSTPVARLTSSAPVTRAAQVLPAPREVAARPPAPPSSRVPVRPRAQVARVEPPAPSRPEAAVRSAHPSRAAMPPARTPVDGVRGVPAESTSGAAVRQPPRPAAGNPRPEYPMLARRRGQQGRVLVRLDVASDGTPSAARVVHSSGVPSLDRAAREAVSRWRFLPARRGGRTEAATVDVPVEFRLDPRG